MWIGTEEQAQILDGGPGVEGWAGEGRSKTGVDYQSLAHAV